MDESTDTIGLWNMTFLGPAGATSQFSSHSGGSASVSCIDCVPESGIGWWNFDFRRGTDSASLETGFFNGQPLYTGESLYLSTSAYTIYNGVNNYQYGLHQYNTGSTASFDGESGAIYTPPGESSSGIVTVASVISTPEPAELGMLPHARIFSLPDG